jgi:mannosylglycerate hydrolase
MAEKKEIVIVPMTHWDREHSRPFEQFRWHLVANVMPKLLHMLATQPDYTFTFDGQSLAMEDYLDICPERFDELRGYARAGRLLIGPFFVGPDEFIPDGESLIRNLILGHKIAAKFSGAMKIGYNPDAFGHIAQMPQIMRGFGIEAMAFMRGVGDDLPPHGGEFCWVAPDGSEVLVMHHGYGQANALPAEPEQARKRLDDIIACAGEKPYPFYLASNGSDGSVPQNDLLDIIKALNEKYPDLQVTCGNFYDHIEKIKPYLAQLQQYRGELHYGKHQMVLYGVYSARLYLKQANAKTQMLLEKLAEPLASWSWMVEAEPYPKALLERAWRMLLENHFHDTICACSQDKVYHDAMMRYAHAQQIAEKLNERSTKVIARNVKTDIGQAEDAVTIIAYNPLGFDRHEVVDVRLYQSFAEEAPQPGYSVRDADGTVVPSQIRNAKTSEYFIPYMWERSIPYNKYMLQYDLAIDADVPALGYQTYIATPGAATTLASDLTSGDNWIENALVRLEAATNGTLTVTEKASGRRLEGLHLFEDIDSTCGEYNHYHSPNPKRITSARAKAKVSIVERGSVCATLKIELTMRLPESASEDYQTRSKKLVNYPITTFVTLSANSARIDFHTIFDNCVKDHRLQVLFPTGIKSDHVSAETPFAVVDRPIALPKAKDWMEPPVPEAAQQTFVDVSDGKAGFALFNQGLTEYTSLKTRNGVTLALTLVRGVGWIGRPGYITAAYLLPTPDAQCLGQREAHYAIQLHEGDWQQAQLWQAGHSFNAPLQGIETTKHDGKLPSSLSFMTLAPANLVVSAVKQAERDKALIVRLCNMTGEAVEANLTSFKPVKSAQLTNMLEKPIGDATVNDRIVTFPVKGYQIVTLKLELE